MKKSADEKPSADRRKAAEKMLAQAGYRGTGNANRGSKGVRRQSVTDLKSGGIAKKGEC